MALQIQDSRNISTEQDLLMAEKALGLSLPSVYRKFLLIHNGDRVRDRQKGGEEEALGVESTIQRMSESGKYADFVQLGEQHKPDVLCLAEDGKLCVIECKGHGVEAKDTGYLSHGERRGTLSTENNDGQYFENDHQWLQKNESYIRDHLRGKIEQPQVSAAEKASCRKVLQAFDQTNLRNQNAYHRVVGIAGPNARFGNVGDYIDIVKPERMIQTQISV